MTTREKSPPRRFHRTLLALVAAGGAGMLVLYLITGEEGLLQFFAECVLGLLAAGVVWLIVAPLYLYLTNTDR